MSEQPGIVERPSAPSGKLPKPQNGRRRRRLLQIGCLPFTLLLSACLLLFVNQGLFAKAPTWVSDPGEYLLGQRIAGTLGTLAGLQVVGTWLLGLVGAGTAAAAAAGQGEMLYQRLTILRRRLAITAWTVFALRVAFLIALAIGIVLSEKYITDSWLTVDVPRHPHFMEVVAMVALLSTVLAQWLAGPFLRLHYSTALGAWGGSWTRLRSRRSWMGLTARTGAGMCGSLALLWGSTLGITILGMIHQPFSRLASVDFWKTLFPYLPESSWESIVISLGLSLLIVLYMIGQLALPPLYLKLARRRLGSRAPIDSRWRFAGQLTDRLTSTPTSPE